MMLALHFFKHSDNKNLISKQILLPPLSRPGETKPNDGV